jgi:hypothetical protein
MRKYISTVVPCLYALPALPAYQPAKLSACLPALPACHGGYEFSCSTVVHVYSHRRPPVFSSTLRSCSGAHFAMPVRTVRATLSSEATIGLLISPAGTAENPPRGLHEVSNKRNEETDRARARAS